MLTEGLLNQVVGVGQAARVVGQSTGSPAGESGQVAGAESLQRADCRRCGHAEATPECLRQTAGSCRSRAALHHRRWVSGRGPCSGLGHAEEGFVSIIVPVSYAGKKQTVSRCNVTSSTSQSISAGERTDEVTRASLTSTTVGTRRPHRESATVRRPRPWLIVADPPESRYTASLMFSPMTPTPHMVYADPDGNVLDHPHLLMAGVDGRRTLARARAGPAGPAARQRSLHAAGSHSGRYRPRDRTGCRVRSGPRLRSGQIGPGCRRLPGPGPIP